MNMEGSLNNIMQRFRAQEELFAPRPGRLALQRMKLDIPNPRRVSVNVWRNHAIEPVISLAGPFMAYGRWLADFRMSDYDDAMMFDGHAEADVELLWLDSGRYFADTGFSGWSDWLVSRLKVLRKATKAPIVIALWLKDGGQCARLKEMTDALPAVYLADMGAVCMEAGVELLDPRSASVAGTPVGKSAQPMLARKLACHWLPAAVFPPVKALVLDIDNTLHAGILGEDGIFGVHLTRQHQAFQSYLKTLRQRGVFIALASRNERRDVEELFARRADYPLKLDDFSVTEVSWGEKHAAIKRIADKLRIAPDAVLFVDDNPGELASVAVCMPQVHTVFAHPDASITQRAVEFYPGLWRWKTGPDDSKRVRDLAANAEREELFVKSAGSDEYFCSLEISLINRFDPVEQLDRLSELCSKTNQFNLALRRFNQAELSWLIERDDACVASVQLKDRLSDSGVIAVIAAERSGEELAIEELCVSCRALGRRLEDTIILGAISGMPLFAGCSRVVFRVQHGPRNQPALRWLSELFGLKEIPGPGLYPLESGRISGFVPVKGVTLAGR